MMSDGIFGINAQLSASIINRINLTSRETRDKTLSVKSQTRFKQLRQSYEFGGTLMKRAKNRYARPVSTREPTHLILKSSKAIGCRSFGHSKNLREVKAAIDRHCAKYGVKLMMYSNNFNHLHLLVKFPSRALYLRFIRSLTGTLAMITTGAKKAAAAAGRFFDNRPFTRIVRGRKSYQIACDYIRLNQLEAAGVIPYQMARLRNLTELERSFF